MEHHHQLLDFFGEIFWLYVQLYVKFGAEPLLCSLFHIITFSRSSEM